MRDVLLECAKANPRMKKDWHPTISHKFCSCSQGAQWKQVLLKYINYGAKTQPCLSVYRDISQYNPISTCCVSSHLQGNIECEIIWWKTTNQEIFAEIEHLRQNESCHGSQKNPPQKWLSRLQPSIRTTTELWLCVSYTCVRDIPWFIKIILLATGMSYSNFWMAQNNTLGLILYKSWSSVSYNCLTSVSHVIIAKGLDP